MKKTAKKSKVKLIITVAVIAVAIAGAAAMTVYLIGKNEKPPVEQSQGMSEFESVVLEEGLELSNVSAASGAYPEDGSGAAVEKVVCATFKNTKNVTLQYAKLKVSIGDRTFDFEFSTIPAGESVLVFEKNKATADKLSGDVAVSPEYIVFFNEEPTLLENDIEITVENGEIKVKNISGVDIDREISVFFKNKMEDKYLGGITYRVRIPAVKAGETVGTYSSHASKDATEIMFCQYGA